MLGKAEYPAITILSVSSAAQVSWRLAFFTVSQWSLWHWWLQGNTQNFGKRWSDHHVIIMRSRRKSESSWQWPVGFSDRHSSVAKNWAPRIWGPQFSASSAILSFSAKHVSLFSWFSHLSFGLRNRTYQRTDLSLKNPRGLTIVCCTQSCLGGVFIAWDQMGSGAATLSRLLRTPSVILEKHVVSNQNSIAYHQFPHSHFGSLVWHRWDPMGAGP